MAKKYSVTVTQINCEAALIHTTDLVRRALHQSPVIIELSRPEKTRDQEKLYHVLIGEIAAQVKPYGKAHDAEVWKALLVDYFEQEMRAQGRPLRRSTQIVPAMDGSGRLVTVRPSTTKYTKGEGSAFIEFLYAQGVEMGVRWSATAEQIREYEMMQQAG